MKVGVPIGDLLAGMYGAYGAVAALHERERTGRGHRRADVAARRAGGRARVPGHPVHRRGRGAAAGRATTTRRSAPTACSTAPTGCCRSRSAARRCGAGSRRPSTCRSTPPASRRNSDRVAQPRRRHRRGDRRLRAVPARRAAAPARRGRHPRGRGPHPGPGLRLGPDAVAGPAHRGRSPTRRPDRPCPVRRCASTAHTPRAPHRRRRRWGSTTQSVAAGSTRSTATADATAQPHCATPTAPSSRVSPARVRGAGRRRSVRLGPPRAHAHCSRRQRHDRTGRQRTPLGPGHRRRGGDGARRGPRQGRRRRRADPRQRPPGRQPAGQERARRGRGAARTAGLVRCTDAGHDRLPHHGRPRPCARRRAASTGSVGDARDAHPRRRRGPRLRPPDQADRPLPAGREAARSSSTDRPGKTGARVAGGGSSRRRTRSRSSTRRPSVC